MTDDDMWAEWERYKNKLDFLEKKNIKLPTAEQLTMIAATLMRNINDKPDTLADASINLWFASLKRISIAYDKEIRDEMDEIYFGDFPITRDQFLEKMLPQYKSRTADLARLGKSFQRHILRNTNKKEPTMDEVAAAYGAWKPYENLDQVCAEADRFEVWHKQYVKEARRDAGEASATKQDAKREAAKAAAEKKDEKKALTRS